MRKANTEIREAMREKHVPAWAIGEALGVHENTVLRHLRTEQYLSRYLMFALSNSCPRRKVLKTETLPSSLSTAIDTGLSAPFRYSSIHFPIGMKSGSRRGEFNISNLIPRYSDIVISFLIRLYLRYFSAQPFTIALIAPSFLSISFARAIWHLVLTRLWSV